MVLGIYGASGLGTEYEYLASIINDRESRWEEIVFIDDTPEKMGTTLVNRPILGFEQALEKYGIDGIEIFHPSANEEQQAILKKYATTGDGILTAIMLTEEICDSKLPLSELAAPVKLYPQYTLNIRVKDKNTTLSKEDVLCSKKEVEKLIDGKGRVLLRKSGTEPVVRIMIECESEEKCKEYAQIIADKITEKGYRV